MTLLVMQNAEQRMHPFMQVMESITQALLTTGVLYNSFYYEVLTIVIIILLVRYFVDNDSLLGQQWQTVEWELRAVCPSRFLMIWGGKPPDAGGKERILARRACGKKGYRPFCATLLIILQDLGLGWWSPSGWDCKQNTRHGRTFVQLGHDRHA